MKKVALFFVMVFVLSACAAPKTREARINSDINYQLPHSPWKQNALTAYQQVTLRYEEKLLQFQAIVQLKPEDVKITLLDPAGRRAIDLSWDERQLTAQKASWVPDAMNANDILARMILAFWPLDHAREGLAADVSLDENAEGRRLYQKNTDIIAVTYSSNNPWMGTTVIEQLGTSFHLTITSRLKEVN